MEIIILAYDPTIPDAVALTKAGVFNYIEMAVDEEVITAQAKSALKEKKDKLIKHLMPNWALNKNIFKFLPDLDIIRQLGTGSTGIVFQVRKSNAFYALKILRSDLAPEMHQLQREGKFLSEAEILSKLKHNNIVQIFDYGFSENFMPYILMEFVNGKTLTEIIKNNKLDFKKRLNIFIQTCKAIQFIHKNGILHRDIKPGNIIVSDDLAVKLTDFGLAHIIDADGDETGNIIIGSPAYMSPETFDKNAAVDHSSDIFSLGILGYELFTGEKPFIGNNILEIRHSICHRKPPAPRKIVPELEVEIEKILSKMLAKKPQDRFENLSKVINSGSKILADSNMYKEAKKNKSLFGLFKGRSSTWA
jgi:serine/threonine-protein kinase